MKTLPSLLFLDARGRVVIKNSGSLGISGVLELAKEVIIRNTNERDLFTLI